MTQQTTEPSWGPREVEPCSSSILYTSRRLVAQAKITDLLLIPDPHRTTQRRPSPPRDEIRIRARINQHRHRRHSVKILPLADRVEEEFCIERRAVREEYAEGGSVGYFCCCRGWGDGVRAGAWRSRGQEVWIGAVGEEEGEERGVVEAETT